MTSVVHFDLSCCDCLISGHLEQLAISCPNTQKLNLQYSEDCLTSLQGLRAITTYCEKLQGLNILGITRVENQVQLWKILSDIKLTHLAVDLCVLEPKEEDDQAKLVEQYQIPPTPGFESQVTWCLVRAILSSPPGGQVDGTTPPNYLQTKVLVNRPRKFIFLKRKTSILLIKTL